VVIEALLEEDEFAARQDATDNVAMAYAEMLLIGDNQNPELWKVARYIV
jgi:hypothetical protein